MLLLDVHLKQESGIRDHIEWGASIDKHIFVSFRYSKLRTKSAEQR